MNNNFLTRVDGNLQRYEEGLMVPKYTLESAGEDNFYHGLLTLIVFKSSLKVQIEQMYNRCQGKYAIAAESHQYYVMFKNSYCTVDKIELSLKLLGLFAVDGDKVLLELIKKGWPKIFNALERLKNKKDASALQKMFKRADSEGEYLQLYILACFYNKIYQILPDGFSIPVDLISLKYSFFDKAIAFSNDPFNYSVSEESLEKFARLFGIDPSYLNRPNDLWLNHSEFGIFFDILSYYCLIARFNPKSIMIEEMDSEIMKKIICCVFEKDLLDKKDVIKEYCSAVIIGYMGQEYHKLRSKYFQLKEERSNVKLSQKIKEYKKDIKRLKSVLSRKEKLIDDLDADLQKEKRKNRKLDAQGSKRYNDMLKEVECRSNKKISALEEENKMLNEMLSDLLKTGEQESQPKEESVCSNEKLQFIKKTSGILYVCKEGSGIASMKLQYFKEFADNIKLYTSENDVVPSDISYIFFDYQLMNHGIYYKVKGIGKKGNIPLYYLQSGNPEKNIEEMYELLKTELQENN